MKLLQSFNKDLVQAEVGKLVKAYFLSASGLDFYFDIGEKQEGICPQSEFDKLPSIGDEFSVVVLRRQEDNLPLLSKRLADHRLAWQYVKEIYEARANLSVTVTNVLPAGYMVKYESVELFMPFSQSDVNPNSTRRFPVGKEMDVRVLELKEDRHSAIVSHRRLIEERNDLLWDQFLQTHQVGDIVEGIVVKKIDFGILVEVESLIGLLHMNDISWKKHVSFKKQFSLKDKISLKILDVNRENNRLSLGLKQMTQDPWLWVKDNLQVGGALEAKVTSLANYAAFLEIREGVEGLLHASEMSWAKKPPQPAKILKVGQSINVKILQIDLETRHISLSLKQMTQDPWSSIKAEIKVGDVRSGKVTGITQFGTFVKLRPGVDGLIHHKDYSWEEALKEKDIKNKLKKGQTIQFKILEINAKEHRIACGIKQLTDSPHLAFKKKHPKGSVVEGKVKRIVPFGIIMSLPDKMNGLVPTEQIKLGSDQKLENTCKVGDRMPMLVHDVDVAKRKIYLSLKGYEKKQESAVIGKYLQSENTALYF